MGKSNKENNMLLDTEIREKLTTKLIVTVTSNKKIRLVNFEAKNLMITTHIQERKSNSSGGRL